MKPKKEWTAWGVFDKKERLIDITTNKDKKYLEGIWHPKIVKKLRVRLHDKKI